MIVCRKCNSQVEYYLGAPDWYRGSVEDLKYDYFECPECGVLHMDEVVVIKEKKTKEVKMLNKKKSELVIADEEKTASFDQIAMIAGKLFKSGLFTHLSKPEQAVAIVEYGRELGIPPMQSLQMMAVIRGKIAIQSQLLLALAMKNGCDIEIIEQTKEKCEMIFKRQGRKYPVSFTYEEAKELELTGKDNWRKQSANMLFWRCVSKAIRRYAPDLMLGIYTIEEMTAGEQTTVEEIQEEVKSEKKLASSENAGAEEHALLTSEIKSMMLSPTFTAEEREKMRDKLKKNFSLKVLRILKEKIGERLMGKNKKTKVDTDQKITYDELYQTLFEMLGAKKLRVETDKLCKEFKIEKIEDAEKDAEMMGKVLIRMQEIRDNV